LKGDSQGQINMDRVDIPFNLVQLTKGPCS
jgi:hypothetical protein